MACQALGLYLDYTFFESLIETSENGQLHACIGGDFVLGLGEGQKALILEGRVENVLKPMYLRPITGIGTDFGEGAARARAPPNNR